MFEEIPEEELDWCAETIIGLTLTMGGNSAVFDSTGQIINPNAHYRVAKHLPTGMIVIVPVVEESFINLN